MAARDLHDVFVQVAAGNLTVHERLKICCSFTLWGADGSGNQILQTLPSLSYVSKEYESLCPLDEVCHQQLMTQVSILHVGQDRLNIFVLCFSPKILPILIAYIIYNIVHPSSGNY